MEMKPSKMDASEPGTQVLISQPVQPGTVPPVAVVVPVQSVPMGGPVVPQVAGYPTMTSNQMYGHAGPMNYPGVPAQAPPNSSTWSSGICDCCASVDLHDQPVDDCCGLCCLTTWCPCITYGGNVERLHPVETECGGNYNLAALTFCALMYLPQLIGCPSVQCFVHMGARSAIRRRYGLPEEPCNDCCVTCCCPCCALIQESKELTKRGATRFAH